MMQKFKAILVIICENLRGRINILHKLQALMKVSMCDVIFYSCHADLISGSWLLFTQRTD